MYEYIASFCYYTFTFCPCDCPHLQSAELGFINLWLQRQAWLHLQPASSYKWEDSLPCNSECATSCLFASFYSGIAGCTSALQLPKLTFNYRDCTANLNLCITERGERKKKSLQPQESNLMGHTQCSSWRDGFFPLICWWPNHVTIDLVTKFYVYCKVI